MAANPPARLAKILPRAEHSIGPVMTVKVMGTTKDEDSADSGMHVARYLTGKLSGTTDFVPSVFENYELKTKKGVFRLWHSKLSNEIKFSRLSELNRWDKADQILLCIDVSCDTAAIELKFKQYEGLMNCNGYDWEKIKQQTSIIFTQVDSEPTLTTGDRFELVQQLGFDSVVEINTAVDGNQGDIFDAIVAHQAVEEAPAPVQRKRDKFKQKFDDKFKQKFDDVKGRVSDVATSFFFRPRGAE